MTRKFLLLDKQQDVIEKYRSGESLDSVAKYLYTDDCYRFLHRKTLQYKDNKIFGAKCTG